MRAAEPRSAGRQRHMDEHPIMRHMCNLGTVKTYEGTDDIQTLVIGGRVTGVAAYK